MIGRGQGFTRTFQEGKDKTHFLIFDYLGNFEFFRVNKEVTRNETSLSETSLQNGYV